jgi:hypothetical protein
MGSRNIDRIPMREWRASVETVADMLAKKWEVITSCQKCGLAMVADLALIARETGPETSLWNRSSPCRRISCTGVVAFMAKPPGKAFHETLSAPWPEGKPCLATSPGVPLAAHRETGPTCC